MNLSKFFVDRPNFAAVISVIIFLAGLIAIPEAPDLRIPGSGAAIGSGARAVPGAPTRR